MRNIEIESYDLNSAMESKRLGYLMFGSEQLGQLIFGSEPVAGSGYLLQAYEHFQKFFSNFTKFLDLHPQILNHFKVSKLVGESLSNGFQVIKETEPMIKILFNALMLIKILKILKRVMPKANAQDQMDQDADSKACSEDLSIAKIDEETARLQDRIRAIQEFNNTAEEFSQLKNQLDEIMTELSICNNDSQFPDQFSEIAYAFTQSAQDIHQQAQVLSQKLREQDNMAEQLQLELELESQKEILKKSSWSSCTIL